MCHIIRLLPFLPSPSILEAKIEDCVYNVVVFYAGTRLDRGAEERTYGTLGHGGNVCPACYLSINYPDFGPRFTL